MYRSAFRCVDLYKKLYALQNCLLNLPSLFRTPDANVTVTCAPVEVSSCKTG